MTTTSQGADNQSVIQHDIFDAQAFTDTRAQFTPLDEIATTQAIPEAETFTQDVFMSFYKHAPQLEAEEDLSLTAQFRRRLLDEIMHTSEYQRVRGLGTAQDTYGSAMATASTAYAVIDKLDGRTKRQMREMQGAEEAARELMNQAQALRDFAEDTQDEEEAASMETEAGELEAQAQQQQQTAETAAAALAGRAEEIEDQARRAARAALSQAEGELGELNDAITAYGGYGAGEGDHQPRMGSKEKMELAGKLKNNKKLAKIAELAGKMVNTALKKQRNKVIHPPDEIVGVTMGDDLTRLLPSELLYLEDEVTEPLFYQKYINRELLQYDMIGHERQAKGAIIANVDLSGSMGELLISEKRIEKKLQGMSATEAAQARQEIYQKAYTKEIWAKAVLLALLAIAHLQKRDFCVVYFGYGPNEIKVYKFPKATATTAQLIQLAEDFFGGGTSYHEWMIESLKIGEKGPFDQADNIIISDGEVGILDEKREDFNTRRNAKKMHCYGILLVEGRRAKTSGDVMRGITDDFISITDLERDTKALDMLFNI